MERFWWAWITIGAGEVDPYLQCSDNNKSFFGESQHSYISFFRVVQTYSEVDLTASHHVVQEGVLSHQLKEAENVKSLHRFLVYNGAAVPEGIYDTEWNAPLSGYQLSACLLYCSQ